jgi:chromosome segregation ATPase
MESAVFRFCLQAGAAARRRNCFAKTQAQISRPLVIPAKLRDKRVDGADGMSDDRMERIETVLAALAAEMAAIRAETAAIRAEMAAIRAEMATKQDLADVARNVDVSALGRQMRELLAMKDDVTVLTAIVQRLDNTMARQMSDLLTEVRAEHSRMDRLLHRVRELEEAQPP